MAVFQFIRSNEKVWGREDVFADTGSYCGKLMRLNKGYRCSIHKHLEKDETFHILSGLVRLEIFNDDQTQTEVHMMRPGDSFRILPGTYHRFTGLADSAFVEVSSKDSAADNVRLTASGPAE